MVPNDRENVLYIGFLIGNAHSYYLRPMKWKPCFKVLIPIIIPECSNSTCIDMTCYRLITCKMKNNA